MKRYLILVQHEVIMYGDNEKAAESSLLRTEFMKNRTNPKCVYIREFTDDNVIALEDYRKAPGG